ncbi:phosphatase PAP2 family protein [Aldersonia sp. NBC_00410]|uniref:phosphatase PAP2 family protein n=1 Tax=Aldersonia sp. NBC_00410 TaxID=2975954 RepID=UPI002258640D|nr:phosphatase PAP2 family protein [Aldersonia sp. NBC_00410]MCX5041928.1 phosphatase PAP2 family protein [Aldersonia sp. NBC_00410]
MVIGLLLAGVALLLVGVQMAATLAGFQGPLESLAGDYVATPKSASVPWAGLVLAMVGIGARRRVIALAAAAAIDIVFAAGRVLFGGALTVGNGPTIVLTALALIAWLRWHGTERRNALHAAGLGALLILATKIGDTWLHFTASARPNVWDQFALTTDRALGDPSWLLGRAVEAIGPVGYNILHWVYIELPVGAIAVAIWQLRRVAGTGTWPAHYLVRTFLTLGLIGPVIYLLFPVVGPIFAFGSEGDGFQVGNYWPNTLPALGEPQPMPFDEYTPRNCMPSMHTAWALALFLHSRRDIDGGRAPWWLRWGGALWLACTLCATLGFGYHYGVDLLAGAVLCLTVESALRDPERGWGWFRVRLVGGGVIALAGLLLSYRFLSVTLATYPLPSGIVLVGVVAALAGGYYRTFFVRPWPSGDHDGESAALDSGVLDSGAAPSRSTGLHANGRPAELLRRTGR